MAWCRSGRRPLHQQLNLEFDRWDHANEICSTRRGWGLRQPRWELQPRHPNNFNALSEPKIKTSRRKHHLQWITTNGWIRNFNQQIDLFIQQPKSFRLSSWYQSGRKEPEKAIKTHEEIAWRVADSDLRSKQGARITRLRYQRLWFGVCAVCRNCWFRCQLQKWRSWIFDYQAIWKVGTA